MQNLLYLVGLPIFEFLLAHGVSMKAMMLTAFIVGAALAIVSRLPMRRQVTVGPYPRLVQPTPPACVPLGEPRPTFPPDPPGDDGMSWVVTTKGDTEVWELDGDDLPTRRRETGDESEVAFLKRRLDEEMRAKWKLQELILHPPAARIAGRVARVEPNEPEATHRQIWLAVPDEHGAHQALKVRGEVEDLGRVAEGDHLQLALTWRRGRLTVVEIEEHIVADEVGEPMPEVTLPDRSATKVPDWFNSNAKNEKRTMLKASDGSSSVSELRIHLVWATKRRGAVLTAAMVDRLKVLTTEVVTAKGLGRLLAVNGEADHVHVALWLPANLAGSDAAGQIKSYTSRLLRKEFPELLDHDGKALWQRGCYVGSIGQGGDLAGVLRYIADQNVPQAHEDDQEGAEDDDLDQADLA